MVARHGHHQRSQRVQLMAERYWPGAAAAAVRESVSRLRGKCDELTDGGIPIRYLGATFVPADESLSCRFDGTAQAVRTAYELSNATFDRLVVIEEMGLDPSPT